MIRADMISTAGRAYFTSDIENDEYSYPKSYAAAALTFAPIQNSARRKFERYDLVILDELGYILFDKEGSEMLFNLLSNRNDCASTVITTNLSFEKWEDIFEDPIFTGALVDRRAHCAHVLDMSGDSYRIKEAKEWME